VFADFVPRDITGWKNAPTRLVLRRDRVPNVPKQAAESYPHTRNRRHGCPGKIE
jgi:hypothetical protein